LSRSDFTGFIELIREDFPSHQFSHLRLFAFNEYPQQLRCASEYRRWPSSCGISRITLGI
jgi:hypothetical protein